MNWCFFFIIMAAWKAEPFLWGRMSLVAFLSEFLIPYRSGGKGSYKLRADMTQ